jgi:signal transduction histidine kinase/DNA-binding response OmpR family regulator
MNIKRLSPTILLRLLTWFLIIALLPLLIVTVINFLISEQSIQQGVITNMEALAAGKSRQIENYAVERQRDVASLARIPNIIQTVIQLDQPNLPAETLATVREEARTFIAFYAQEGNYQDVFLVSLEGKILFSLKEVVPDGTNVNGRRLVDTEIPTVFATARTLLETELSNFTEFNGEYAAFIAAPIAQDGVIVGVVIAQISNDELYAVVTDPFGLGATGETLVGVVDGDSILVTAPLRSTADAAFNLRIPLKSDPPTPLQKAIDGIRGSGLEIDYRGQAVVAAYRYLPSLRWGLVVKQDTSEALAPIESQRRSLIVLTALTLAGVIFASSLIAQSISNPIIRLTKAVKAISGGQLSARAENITNQDEIGTLAQGINEMGDQLSALVNNLEGKIQERTQSLEQRTQELQTATERAEQANRAKSVFLANMSHELRTPLNAILGFTQLMERDSNMGSKQRENLGVISRSGEHLLGLINDVLEMSKIEAGQASLVVTPFDLHHLLKGVRDMFVLRATSKNIQLLFEIDEEVPQYITTDENKLRQVLINLLGNAVKFTTEGGIGVRVMAQGDQLHFEVEDTGPGISPEEIGKLFQAFSQTESGTKSNQGTGLGLAISRQFVQLMGGDIHVESTVGKGTLFSFAIHYETAQAQQIQTEKQQPRVLKIDPSDTREYRILVVDDKWENRQLMNDWLTHVGFKVKEAENGEIALKIWEEWNPQLIWMDMRMPVMNGYEATRRIKSTIKGNATIVIALTASALEHEKAMILSEGCDDFVRKPARESLIMQKMHEHLGVAFIYETNNETVANKQDFELTREALAVLPTETLQQLRSAIEKIDLEEAQNVLNNIQTTHPEIANALQALVSQFRFDQLQLLVE